MTNGDPSKGRLQPGQKSQPFTPRGPKPWRIKFTNVDTRKECMSPEVTDPAAIVTITSWDPCEFEITEPGNG